MNDINASQAHIMHSISKKIFRFLLSKYSQLKHHIDLKLHYNKANQIQLDAKGAPLSLLLHCSSTFHFDMLLLWYFVSVTGSVEIMSWSRQSISTGLVLTAMSWSQS